MKQEKDKVTCLDDVAILTEYNPQVFETFKIRELSKYCKYKGIKPKDLSEEELKMFEVN